MATPPWNPDDAERGLNTASARDAANFEGHLAKFRPVVLRDDASAEELAWYEAAIFENFIVQVTETIRVGFIEHVRGTGQATPPPTASVPRQRVLDLAAHVLGAARERCVLPDAAADNVESYERLVVNARWRNVSDRARLDLIDTARAAGVQ